MGFLDELAGIAIRGVVGYASSIPEAKEAADIGVRLNQPHPSRR